MLAERIIKGVLAAMAGITVVTSVLIVVALVRPAIAFFGDVSFTEFIGGVDWKPSVCGQFSWGPCGLRQLLL
jgi:phosphate transport system permease protein